MATLDSVKAKIQSLISKANSKTGRADTDMTAAVDALIAGFGQGGGITPTGTKTITANGTHDVTEFATAEVAVPAPEQMTVVRTVTISADVTGANNTYTLLSGDAFIKKHYADEGFFVMWFPVTPVASATGVIHSNYHGNRNISSTTKAYTGFGLRSTSASAVGNAYLTAAINGKGYSQHMRVDSSGNLLQYLNSGYILKAGTYKIILTCTT